VNGRQAALVRNSKNKRYGYAKSSLTLKRWLDFLLSLTLLIVGSPIFLVIAIAIKLTDSGPVFYKQPRLGYQKRLFDIYKFRTLIPGADKIIGSEVINREHHVVTPIGKFLRDTRLDELPQLINILKGDMSFIGPRPQRPEIYKRFGRHIKNYDKRFSVKPGLIGFPQLFLPHSAPKKIQSRIDNLYMKIKQNYFWEISLIFFTIFNVLKKFIVLSADNFLNNFIKVKLLKTNPKRRVLVRKKPEQGAYLYLLKEHEDKHGWNSKVLKLRDINEEAFSFQSKEKLNMEGKFLCKITVNFKFYGKFKRKTVLCKCSLVRERKEQDGFSYIVFYEPITPLNFYKAHQYLLRKSMAYG